MGACTMSTLSLIHILFLSWQGRPNMYNVNGLAFDSEIPMYLELTLPSGELWTKGEPNDKNYIKGSAKDWACLLYTSRCV